MSSGDQSISRSGFSAEATGAVAAAAQLDREGRHTDAINVLSAAARQGDVAAKGRVGARILIGDRAPALPAQGVSLIAEAAHDGDAESAALAAVLAGAGAFRPQSWDDALDWLARAAELGSAPAQGQLAVLARDHGLTDAQAAAAAPPSSWQAVRARIDLPALLAPPPGEDLAAEPLVRRFAGFASPEACDWLIARAGERLSRATVYDGYSEQNEVAEVRTNSIRIFGLLETDLVQLLLQARMAAAVGAPPTHMEALSVLHYAEGQQISDHYDFIRPEAPGYAAEIARHGQRAVTFLVYLNESYEGGETEFPKLGVRHKGVRGEGLFFVNALASGAPDLRSAHAGRPPRNGEKWIVSQFIRSRPFMPGAV